MTTSNGWPSQTQLDQWTDLVLATAQALGATFTEFRFRQTESMTVAVNGAIVANHLHGDNTGCSIRLLFNGQWGFAAGNITSSMELRSLVEQAMTVARAAALLGAPAVELAPAPAQHGHYQTPFAIDPLEVNSQERLEFFLSITDQALKAGVTHADLGWWGVKETTYLATSDGTAITQCLVRQRCELTGTLITDGQSHTMRTLCPPRAAGWEYLTGYGFHKEADELAEYLREQAQAPSVEPGEYTIVMAPSHSWLGIHEMVGHATEWDRILGYEGGFAGTSWVKREDLGQLVYGSPLMHVTGDRTSAGGLATTGWDDEGVPATSWDIITAGQFVGTQLNREMAGPLHVASNGCAYTSGYNYPPISRMPNVSLQPATTDVTLEDLFAQASDGLYFEGDRGWSIDMTRTNGQFSPQRAYRIRGGRLVGQVRPPTYVTHTPTFWKNLAAVGGPGTVEQWGSMQCGKSQPQQVAPASHAAPATMFTQVSVRG